MTINHHIFFLPLTLIAAGLMLSSCSMNDRSAQQQRGSTEKILVAYANAMKTGDYNQVPFAPAVTFLGPLTNGPIVGETQVKNFLRNVSKDVQEIRVKHHVIDGERACVIAELVTKKGIVVPFCEFFRITNGDIAEIRPYFDPRLLIGS